MANYFNHSRTRARTFEYARLGLQELKEYSALPMDTEFWLSWTVGKQFIVQVLAMRTMEGFSFRQGNGRAYGIKLDKTLVTYGERSWYLCPVCNRRSAILYYAGIFACSECVKPAYESQNGSKHAALAIRIRDARRKLWGRDVLFVDDLTQSCRHWSKPKGVHSLRFQRDRDRILALEEDRIDVLLADLRGLLNSTSSYS